MKEIDWDSLKKLIADEGLSNDVGKLDKSFTVTIEKGENPYVQRKRLLAYWAYFSKCPQSKSTVLILRLLFEYISTGYKPVYEMIQEDLKEIEACLSVKAYKAAIILSGSVLEAFLLYWLSEKDGRDYFEEPYMIEVMGEDGKTQWKKKDDLWTYINQIKEIEKPEWMDSSEKAHYIRQKRNSVHARLCLKEGTEINEETCQKVLDYLVEIIELKFSSWTSDKEPDFIIRF